MFYGYSPALLILSVTVGLFAILLLSLGLIGDQIRLLAERSRNVPLVIEEERLNFVRSGRSKDAQSKVCVDQTSP